MNCCGYNVLPIITKGGLNAKERIFISSGRHHNLLRAAVQRLLDLQFAPQYSQQTERRAFGFRLTR